MLLKNHALNIIIMCEIVRCRKRGLCSHTKHAIITHYKCIPFAANCYTYMYGHDVHSCYRRLRRGWAPSGATYTPAIAVVVVV